jgi:hypothetical protein
MARLSTPLALAAGAALAAATHTSFLSPTPAGAAGAAPPPRAPGETLILEDDFDALNVSLWKHELTLSGEGNWEFEW